MDPGSDGGPPAKKRDKYKVLSDCLKDKNGPRQAQLRLLVNKVIAKKANGRLPRGFMDELLGSEKLVGEENKERMRMNRRRMLATWLTQF
jgi:hypothetical protein